MSQGSTIQNPVSCPSQLLAEKHVEGIPPRSKQEMGTQMIAAEGLCVQSDALLLQHTGYVGYPGWGGLVVCTSVSRVESRSR